MNAVPAVVLAVLVTTATLGVGGVAGAAAPSQEADSETYAGAHVAFEASGAALTDYRVGGDPLFASVAVDSQENHRSDADLGADVALSAVTDVSGTGLELEARSETRAAVRTEGSASLTAHDGERGILTVDAGEDAQYVEVALAGDAVAESEGEGEDRVVVETENRSGAFVVAGDGDLAVTDEGAVVAALEGDSTLVFRSYGDGERTDDARAQEELIAAGTATAEAYVEERDGEYVADVATYGQDVAVTVTEGSYDRVELAAERAESEGTILITSISDAAVKTAEGLEVTVDGEAAVEASSYADLEGAIGGDESRYAVGQATDASATADVLVAVNRFSEREIAIRPADNGDDDAGDGAGGDASAEPDDDGDADGSPGFGLGAALLALLVAAATRVRS